VDSFSTQAQLQLQELLNISKHARQTLSQQRILKSLAFNGMHDRFEAIPEAHKETFEWLLSDNDTDGDVKRHRSSRDSFINWLSSGSGIFHITGKLGSGKSTLMKFLCSKRRTKTELEKWAGMSCFVTHFARYQYAL
jgi:Cdc6-like AAA superfamily ATPase